MRSHRNIVRIPDAAPEVCQHNSPAFVLGAPVDRHFAWLARAEERQKETASQEPQQQQQQPGIPPEFPQIVYKALRFYPDAMKAVARAITEFCGGTYIDYAELAKQQQQQQQNPKAA